MIALAVYSLACLGFGYRFWDLSTQISRDDLAKSFAGVMLAGLGGIVVSILGFIVQAVWS